MNNFNKVIDKAIYHLKEEGTPTNPAISNAVGDLKNALSKTVIPNVNAQNLANALNLQEKPLPANDHLGNGLKEIMDAYKSNRPPKLTPVQIAAVSEHFQKLAPKTPQKAQTYSQSTDTTQTTTPATPKPQQQPNAAQYNPLNQSK